MQGDTFKEWKATGSLLWIHGNRKYHSPLSNFQWLMSVFPYCSGFWKECLVVRIGETLVWMTYSHFGMFNHHSRCAGLAQSWASHIRVFLF
jgi:hypothetical protein